MNQKSNGAMQQQWLSRVVTATFYAVPGRPYVSAFIGERGLLVFWLLK
jgi:hypothetical protein